MLGSHLSIADGLHNALIDGQRLGMDCVQIFTKNQRQWSAPPLKRSQIDEWFAYRKSTGIEHVVSHDSYLINLASPGGDTLRKSIALMRDEIERCEALDIPVVVTHPGSHVGEGEDAGLDRIVKSLDAVHADLPGYKTLTLLENTAGQGTNLGYDLHHLLRIIERVRDPERLGVCIDTAHAFAAGYNLGSESGTRKFIRQLDDLIGLELVRAMHLNDSKVKRGSRVDRHEHIGRGHIGLDAFRVIVRNRKLSRVPKCLETAKGEDDHGREWDAVNLATLRELSASRRRKKNPRRTSRRGP